MTGRCTSGPRGLVPCCKELCEDAGTVSALLAAVLALAEVLPRFRTRVILMVRKVWSKAVELLHVNKILARKQSSRADELHPFSQRAKEEGSRSAS